MHYKASQPELLCVLCTACCIGTIRTYNMVLEFYEAAQFTYTRPKDHLPSSSPCNSFAFFLCLPCSVQVVRERELLFCSIISNWLFSFIALRLRLLNELNGYNNLAIYRGSPTYTKITNTVSTTTIFGLCTCKWGDFCVSRGFATVPLT